MNDDKLLRERIVQLERERDEARYALRCCPDHHGDVPRLCRDLDAAEQDAARLAKAVNVLRRDCPVCDRCVEMLDAALSAHEARVKR